jgi:hypothetical protein
MDSPIARRVRLLQGLSSDRRSSVRVPVNLEVRYSVAGRRGDGDQLQLIASGVVVRTSGAVTALRIERYELRTRRAGLKVVPRLESVG